MLVDGDKEKSVTVSNLKTPKKDPSKNEINNQVSFRVGIKKTSTPIIILENKAWKAALEFFKLDIKLFSDAITSNNYNLLKDPLKNYHISKLFESEGLKIPNLLAIVKNFELHRDTVTLVLMDFSHEIHASAVKSIFKEDFENSIYTTDTQNNQKIVEFKEDSKLILKIGMVLSLINISMFSPSTDQFYLLISEKNISHAFYE